MACRCCRGSAFPDASFQGVACILATHHFRDVKAVFREALRVISKGCLVIFTAYPEQMAGYWLNEYFPQAMHRARMQMLSKSVLFRYLGAAGFRHIVEESFKIPPDLQDLFLQSGKHKPEIYLQPQVRAVSPPSQTWHLRRRFPKDACGSSKIFSLGESSK